MCVRAAKMRSARNVSPQILSLAAYQAGILPAVAVSQSSLVRAHAHMHTEPRVVFISLAAVVLVGCIFTFGAQSVCSLHCGGGGDPGLSQKQPQIWTNFA
jgi:hypothetical protein